MFSSTAAVLLLGLFTSCYAWLPSEKALFNKHHTNATNSFRDERRWLPASGKIRGVNLGSMFVVEPWMAEDEWASMGCGSAASEFDCVVSLGQEAANAAFQTHWSTWITQNDLQQMSDLGLNTIRVPIGYWMNEDLVYADSEHFPQGGFAYLEQLVGWASDLGFFIILDLHGAPGAQTAGNADTGQDAPTAGFYVSWQYERAYEFLEWMTNITHTNNNFRDVGMLEIVNEPTQDSSSSEAQSLISEYYPTAWSTIRGVESQLGIAASNRVHIQMMDQRWGAGNPNADLTDLYYAAYDDHRYIKYDTSVALTRDAYLAASCNDDLSGNWPVIIGEWTLSVATSVEWSTEFDPTQPGAVEWYQLWWAAQVMAYEKQEGWIFWSWKANWIGGMNDWRWSYQAAVQAGAIPTDPDDAYNLNACAGVSKSK